MKYIPLNYKHREYYGPHWNWQFIRNIQRILHVAYGAVMHGEEFFNRAFGQDLNEFSKILYMPESILMYRKRQPESNELTWINQFDALTDSEKLDLLSILNLRHKDKIKDAFVSSHNRKIKNIGGFYV